MKKYLNKRTVMLLIIFIYIFFLGFKFLKGKSFFDTIVEYSNDIHSINADMMVADRDDYSLMTQRYISINYLDYRETGFGRYIVRKEKSDNLYLYNPVNGQESLFAKIDPGFKLYELVVNDNYVIWLEIKDIKDNSEKIYWKIYSKMINSDNKFLIDEGSAESKANDKNIYMKILPREFNLEQDTLIYTKYNENIMNKNNIITTTIMTNIVKYDLKNKKSKIINSSCNNYKEEISNIKIDGNNIIWQKKYKDYKKDEIIKTEVYKYSIIEDFTEKVYETSDIYAIDIKNENIAIVVKNPEDNIMIYNIEDKSFTNIFYKGSRIEKFVRGDSKDPVIVDINFITAEKLFIAISPKKNHLSSVIYDLEKKEFLNFDKEVYKNIDTSLIQYKVNKNKLIAYVGIESKNENLEGDISNHSTKKILENGDLFNQNNLYYKYFEYLIR